MRSPYGFNLEENCQGCKLRSHGFFCNFPPKVLREFESIKYTMAYPEGAVLFAEGGAARGVYMLCRGRVKLSMSSPQGRALILRIGEPGDILGVDTAVSGKPFQATAETLEPCQINFVSINDFQKFLRDNIEASLHVSRELSRGYEIVCHRIRALGLSQSAPERLARFLLDWAAMGFETQKGTRARLTLTHEEIGQLIGASRETVTRIFGVFRSKRLITLQGSNLFIQNPAGLKGLVAF